MKEIWKDIPQYEGIYQASNMGRIRSLLHRGGKKPSLMKTQERNGYLRVPLTDKNGNRSHKSVHRLVLESFLGCIENHEVNHKNGIKSDNRISNLEWCTRSENQTHAFKNGLQIPLKGSEIGNSILTENDILRIRSEYKKKGVTYQSLANEYNTSKQNVYCIIKRKTWSHV